METDGNNTIAPFVLKTYQMVNDPRIDALITWGRANNSFMVVEPLEFSEKILPAFFKHNNFSSFIRQLNTYGFRKVDPDKWEFANEWFLRGQTHLLKNIVRRKNGRSLQCRYGGGGGDEEDEEEMFSEITRMKQEQKDMEEELESMSRRLEATERRPEQMMAFLCKVVEEPEILPRMMLVGRERVARRVSLTGAVAAGEKKMKLMITSPAGAARCSVKNEEDGGVTVGANSSIHLPDAKFDVDTLCQSSPENLSTGWWSRSDNNCSTSSTTSSSSRSSDSGGFTVATPLDVFSGYDSMGSGPSAPTTPPYPFSLLEGGL